MKRKKIMIVIGTRPEAIKMAPLILSLKNEPWQVQVLVTGQHRELLAGVLALFKIRPDWDLDAMCKTRGLSLTGAFILKEVAAILERVHPDLVLVHGDTQTTFFSALAAFYARIPVGHVEAGLRSFDLAQPFPEEANRRFTDTFATLFFAPTAEAKKNLLREGVSSKNIFVTGNTVLDALSWALQQPGKTQSASLNSFLNHEGKKILVTAHRRENWDRGLESLSWALQQTLQKYPDVKILFPLHPNPAVRKKINARVLHAQNLLLIEPLGYLDFVRAMRGSDFILSDSGGVQEESPALGKPLLIMRKKSERPEAILSGSARLVGDDRKGIFSAVETLLCDKKAYAKMARVRFPFGHSGASKKIISAMKEYLFTVI